MLKIFIVVYFILIVIFGVPTILDGDLIEDFTISPREIYNEWDDLNWPGAILLYLFKLVINPFPFILKFLKFLATK